MSFERLPVRSSESTVLTSKRCVFCASNAITALGKACYEPQNLQMATLRRFAINRQLWWSKSLWQEKRQAIRQRRDDVEHGEYATQQDCSCTLNELNSPQHSNQMQRNRQPSSANVASFVTTALKRKGAGVIIMLPCNSIVAF